MRHHSCALIYPSRAAYQQEAVSSGDDLPQVGPPRVPEIDYHSLGDAEKSKAKLLGNAAGS